METWQTDMTLGHCQGKISIPHVKIRRGIFQGDSLSPLLFCMAIDPLSKLLSKDQGGYNLSAGRQRDPAKRVNHLFMDDLKVYGSNNIQLCHLLRIVHTFSQDIGMRFGLEKCAKCTLRQGKKAHTKNLPLSEEAEIRIVFTNGLPSFALSSTPPLRPLHSFL